MSHVAVKCAHQLQSLGESSDIDVIRSCDWNKQTSDWFFNINFAYFEMSHHDAIQGLFTNIAQRHLVTFETVCTIPTCKWLWKILINTVKVLSWMQLLIKILNFDITMYKLRKTSKKNGCLKGFRTYKTCFLWWMYSSCHTACAPNLRFDHFEI